MISEKRVQIIGSNDIICPICIKMDNPENISDEENPDDAEIYKPPKFIQVFGNWIEYAYHILEVHTDSDRAEWAKGCLESADKPLTRPEKPVAKLNSKPKIKPQVVVEDDIEIEPILEPIEKVETKKAEKSTLQVDNPWLDMAEGYENTTPKETEKVVKTIQKTLNTEIKRPKTKSNFIQKLLKIVLIRR